MDTAIDSTRHKVASYGTVDGATRAAARLVEVGFDESEVLIAPRGFHHVDIDSLARRLARATRAGAWTGAAVAGGIALLSVVGFDSLVATVIPEVVFGLLLGAVCGGIVGLLRHRRARRLTFGGPRADLAPDHFDIAVRDAADRANHELARWWDPAAAPTRPSA